MQSNTLSIMLLTQKRLTSPSNQGCKLCWTVDLLGSLDSFSSRRNCGRSVLTYWMTSEDKYGLEVMRIRLL